MTLPQLKLRLAYWKTRLNLPEWKIALGWGTVKDMEGDLGRCAWNVEELEAIVKLNRRDPQQETTLVHELLHIVIQGHADYETYDPHLERAINRIANALMESS